MKQLRSILTLLVLLYAFPSYAGDQLTKIDTRQGVKIPVYYMKRDSAKATVVLLPGGAGGIGMRDGLPTSNNFLVRSRDYFAANGFNVAVVAKPSDMQELDYAARISTEHIQDLRTVVEFLKKDSGLPIWIVGTSRGTVSATAAAIAFGNEQLAGIVLTSSVVNQKITGAVPYQKLESIKIPVLVFHHEYDGCKLCNPRDVSLIIERLANAPVKKEIYVKGGKDPSGNPCEAMHWHGYIGMEKEAVNIISDWIKKPIL